MKIVKNISARCKRKKGNQRSKKIIKIQNVLCFIKREIK